MKRIAVIGGGPAGLAAAWTATGAGASVALYEAEPELGGRMRTDSLNGFRIDYAVQLLSSTYENVWRLAREAGVSDRLVRTSGRDALWRRGRANVLQYGSVASMVASTALPAGLKLRLGVKYLPYLQTRAHGLDANDPAHTGGAALDGKSVAAWGEAELGRDFVELMAYPLLGAYYGAEPEELSSAFFHALAKVGQSVEVYAFADGVGALAHEIGSALRGQGAEIRTGTRVQNVSTTDDRVQVTSAEGTETFDGCVVAVPGWIAADLIDARGQTAAFLASVRSLPALTVALLVDGEPRLGYFGLTFPRDSRMGRDLVAVCVQSVKRAGLVPTGKELLVAFAAPARARELIDAPGTRVVDTLLGAVDAALPGVSDRVEHARVYRMPAGYTLFYPGFLKRIAAYDPGTLPGALALAGDYLAAPTVEGAALSGVRAAKRLISARSSG